MNKNVGLGILWGEGDIWCMRKGGINTVGGWKE
jgi:hypothetical protein